MNAKQIAKWRARRQAEDLSRLSEVKRRFTTASGIEVKDVYTALDVASEAAEELPGAYPMTRGIRASMYRCKPFSMRQVVGLGTAAEANARHLFVLAQGQTGLSNDFDLPTLTGYDSDDPCAEGEVGRVGVAIDTIHDVRTLMEGIPLDKVSTSMTINHPAAVLLGMYLGLAQKEGIPWNRLIGTVQNDSFKEFFAQKTFALPPGPSVRLVVDIIEFCNLNVPSWNPISLCGYQTRDCGGTASQEIGFTFAAAKAYIDEALRRGIDIDDIVPRFSFLMYVHMDVLEEVAKFRAARRLWAKLMREHYGARRQESWRFRVHVQSGAALMTAHQPENNIARGALQCLAAALGGVQSMALSTFDEAYSIPSEKAQRLALRTQQIVALESGVCATPDPLGGSYLVESLTDTIEQESARWMSEIDTRGGMLKATETGWIESVLAEQAYRTQQAIEAGELPVVGVNMHREGNEADDLIDVFRVDPSVEDTQRRRLAQVKRSRSTARVSASLDDLRRAIDNGKNLMPSVVHAVTAEASIGEIFGVMRSVWGTYDPLGIV
jgi:methylmalonyl-CoA mutase, N-terminal domain